MHGPDSAKRCSRRAGMRTDQLRFTLIACRGMRSRSFTSRATLYEKNESFCFRSRGHFVAVRYREVASNAIESASDVRCLCR